jgi:hypothetical protein
MANSPCHLWYFLTYASRLTSFGPLASLRHQLLSYQKRC